MTSVKRFATLARVGITLLALGGCAVAQSAPTAPNVPASSLPTPTNAVPHEPPITAVTCGDTKKPYAQQWYQEGNQLVATMLDAAVEPNFNGLTAYVVELNSHPYDPASTPLVITIPAIAARPQPPPLIPPPTPSANPYVDAQTRHAIEQANAAALHAYQQRLSQQNAALARLRREVQQQTRRLRQLNPPRTSAASSIFGCLALASDRLAGASGEKWLVIWSDLQQTSWQDYIPPSKLNLRDVHVRVIFLPCLSAAQCRTVKAFWGQILHQAAVQDVAYFDPAQSMTLNSFFTP